MHLTVSLLLALSHPQPLEGSLLAGTTDSAVAAGFSARRHCQRFRACSGGRGGGRASNGTGERFKCTAGIDAALEATRTKLGAARFSFRYW